MDDYNVIKNRLLAAVDTLGGLVKKKENQFAAELLAETARRLRQETFTLVILGEFKRGKSTFINALLCAGILPTAIIPLTAIPTIIQYGPQPTARVIFLDGTERTVDLKEIPEYVTERNNPRNQKKVREVYITYPSAFLEQGVILVDTPGVGSAHQHNTEAAYGYLPHADAAVFMISVDAPLSKVELDYLKDICTYVKKLFFVLNKIDVASPDDLAEAVEFTTRVLRENLNDGEVKLFPLSARLALEGKLAGNRQKVEESGMARFEQLLNDFIHQSKGRLILEVTARRSLRVINELELGLQLWRRAMESGARELEDKISRFKTELKKLEEEREDSIYLLYREVDRLGKTAEEDVAAFRESILPSLLEQLENYAGEQFRAGLSNKELAQRLNNFIRQTIQQTLDHWRFQEKEKIRGQFEAVALRFFGRIEEVVDRMMAISAEIFEVSFEKTISREYILGDQRFYFHFEEHPTFIPSLESLGVTSLIPRALLHGHIMKSAREKMIELLDRNCGRVRYDLVEGLKEGVRSVAGDLRLRADAVSRSLQTALERAAEQRGASEAERAAATAAWEMEYQELQELKKTFAPLVSD